MPCACINTAVRLIARVVTRCDALCAAQGLIKQLEATGEAVVRVDGPYGGDIPPEWLHYSRLVIFAGGIGVRLRTDHGHGPLSEDLHVPEAPVRLLC